MKVLKSGKLFIEDIISYNLFNLETYTCKYAIYYWKIYNKIYCNKSKMYEN